MSLFVRRHFLYPEGESISCHQQAKDDLARPSSGVVGGTGSNEHWFQARRAVDRDEWQGQEHQQPMGRLLGC